LHAMWYCRQHQFDVIQVHWPFPHGVWGYLAGLSSGTPMTLHFHGAEVLLAKKVFFVQYFLRHALTHAISIFANSGFTAREVNLYSARPVHVVPYGSTLELGSEDKPASQSMKQILFVGRLIERKGIEYLLQAVSLLPADLQWHLNIVGTGDAAETLRAITRRLGLEASVEFHGFVPNEALIHHYRQADLFVLPAITDHKGDTEGLGVVMIEALSYHTPVVASDVGGISDVIINGQTGILVPEKNPDKLAHAIVEILRHPEKARRLAQNGYQHVHTYFDWDRIVNELLEITTQALRHQTN
jgi:phosphatidyl-myo-inositol dimannoside synthase